MEGETIEQRRQRNIQSNFLKLIELGLQPIVKDDVQKDKGPAATFGLDIFHDECNNIEKFKEMCTRKYSHRLYQTRQVFGYVESDIFRMPALICEGPSGSGKSEVIYSIVQDLTFPFGIVKCKGCNSVPRMLGALWLAVKSSLRQYCQSLVKKFSDLNQKHFESVLNQLADESLKPPTKMVQLVNLLKELFSVFFDRIDECSSRPCFFYIVFDRLDEVSGSLEDNTAAKLLQLSSLCHPRIKVVALMRDCSLVRECDVPHYYLSFPPYTTDEIGTICRNKLRDCIEKAVTVELESSFKGNAASLGSAGELTAFCCDVVVPKFEMLIKTATPFIGRIAFNLKSLWDFALLLWNNLYHASLDKAVLDMVQSKLVSPEVDKATVIAFLPSVGVKEIKTAVQSLMSQAYWEVSSGISNCTAGDAHKAAAAVVVAINHNWGKNQNWCSHIPKRQVFLMIAAFLASNNPKESDVQKLTDEKSGRRKKARIGTDDAVTTAGGAAGGGGAGGELGGSLKTGKGLQFRSISLERLVSVFLVVAGTTFKDGLTPRGYGNVEFYSMITSLVSMKYLTPLPSWNIKNPHYISHITHDMAVELSARVSFNLAAYMVGSDTNCPL